MRTVKFEMPLYIGLLKLSKTDFAFMCILNILIMTALCTLHGKTL